MVVKYKGPRPGAVGTSFFSSMFPMIQSLEEVFGVDLRTIDGLVIAGDSMPKLNVYAEQKNKDENKLIFVVEASIAGLNKEDVNITLKGNTLTLTHDPGTPTDPERVYVCRELTSRSFKRNILIPELVDLESIRTKFEHGIVRIEFDVYESDPKAKTIDF